MHAQVQLEQALVTVALTPRAAFGIFDRGRVARSWGLRRPPDWCGISQQEGYKRCGSAQTLQPEWRQERRSSTLSSMISSLFRSTRKSSSQKTSSSGEKSDPLGFVGRQLLGLEERLESRSNRGFHCST